MLKFNLKSALLTTAALAVSAVPALAQLDEIVVTAEKRSTNLQDTPIAITAISEETLAMQQVTNVTEISAMAPNLNIKPGTTNKSAAAIAIRGVGISGEEMMTQDVPTGFYIDGVLISKSAATSIDMADVEQVEVLRGPQGTLFGRNSIGGSVNFKTKRPTDEVGGRLEIGMGDYGYEKLSAKVNLGKITDNLKASVALGRTSRDGVIDNLLQADSKDPGAYETLSGRFAFELDVNDNVNAYYTYDFSNSDSYAQAYQTTAVSPGLAPGFGYADALGNQTTVTGCPTFAIRTSRQDKVCLGNIGESKNDTEGHMLQVDIDLGGMTLRSISGYRDWYFNNGVVDISGFANITATRGYSIPAFGITNTIPANVASSAYAATSIRDHKQFTQELTLISEPGDKVDWVAGIFYLDEEGAESGDQYVWLPFGNPPLIAANTIIQTGSPTFSMSGESRAIYGQLTYHATDELNVTVGGRYTQDEQTISQTLPTAAAGNRKEDNSEPTGHITVDYAYSDNLNTYAKLSRGYRAGGFAARGDGRAFGAETATSFEVGFKSESDDRRFRINGALFTTDYKDRQVTQPVFSAGAYINKIVNASKQTIDGVELEVAAVLTDSLTLEAAIGNVNVETEGFFYLQAGANAPTDISGELVNTVPENTANIALTYKSELPQGQLTARLAANYESEYYSFNNLYSNPQTLKIGTDERTLLNGQVRLDNVAGSNVYVMLWGKNLTDEEYVTRAIDFQALGHGGVYWSDPRTFGVNVGYNF